MDSDPDQALVSRHRSGDRAAFPLLVARYQRPLYNAAYRDFRIRFEKAI